DRKWRAAVDDALEELAVSRADDETEREAEANGSLAGHKAGEERDGCDRHAGGPRRTHDPDAFHRVNSLIFNQTAAAPAARPTNRPTSTNTGDVWKAASSPTPPRIGSKAAPAK